RRRLIIEETVENAVCANEDFPVIVDLDLDAGQRLADGVQLHVTRALCSCERAILGLAIELLQVEPERAEEKESILANRLARRVGALGTGKAKVIAQRREHQKIADGVADPREGPRLPAGKPFPLQAD